MGKYGTSFINNKVSSWEIIGLSEEFSANHVWLPQGILAKKHRKIKYSNLQQEKKGWKTGNDGENII